MVPKNVIDADQLLLVDIRPQQERFEVGYLPGSLSIPWQQSNVLTELLVELKDAETAVLFCTTGRRSELLLQELIPTFPGPIVHLEGGILRWRAEGFPTCGTHRHERDSLSEMVQTTEEFTKALRACFVAEMVERSVNDPEEKYIDPVALFHHCFNAEGLSLEAPAFDKLYRVMDRMGVASRRMGTDLKTIADNTDRMVSLLDQIRF